MEAVDCQPDFCLDLFEPSGHGRKRRALPDNSNSSIEYTKFKENIEYSVLLPGELDNMKFQDPDQCKNFILISGLLALLLTFSTILVCFILDGDFGQRHSKFIHFSFSVMCIGVENAEFQSKNNR